MKWEVEDDMLDARNKSPAAAAAAAKFTWKLFVKLK